MCTLRPARFESLYFRSIGIVFGLFVSSASAGEIVRFHRAELEALQSLAKPETSRLRLDGRRGEFEPGPSLRYWGIEKQEFEIDLNLGGSLVDLRFHDLRASAPIVSMEPGRIVLEITFRDQERAIRSRLGSVSLRGVAVRAAVRFAPNGAVGLEYESGDLVGELRGTGMLRPAWVMESIRKLALKTLRREIERSLARPQVQKSVEAGLVLWARFSRDARLATVLPGSVVVEADAIRYEID